MLRWTENGEELTRVLRAVFTDDSPIEQPKPAPPIPHKDIRIEFKIGSRRYEAVGFLEQGEKPVRGDEMLARTDKDVNVVGDKDYAFILEHRKELPEALQKYRLVTKRRHSDGPHFISYFYRDGYEWREGWGILGFQWHGRDLVLRRLT